MSGDIQELYGSVIRDRGTCPQCSGEIASPDLFKEGVNPLCGDDVQLFFSVEKTIKDLRHHTRGCLLCVASADIMVSYLRKRTIEDAVTLCNQFLAFLDSPSLPSKEKMGELHAICTIFAPVKSYRLRRKCVALPWQTCKEALLTCH